MFLSQGVDYLGFLNTKLRDLGGWSTLANELIQNSDDAQGATRITLDVTNDALVVSNDAQFSDCGAIGAPTGVWGTAGDGKKCCDFHAFRRVASGHKRVEQDTTGAFGIGFISAYQITDEPELRSGRWRWKLHPDAPEDRRIFAEALPSPLAGTQFEFPWARNDTALRRALGRPPISDDIVSEITRDLRRALVQATSFLKRLTTLELRVNGAPALTVECERETASGDILVVVGGQARVWKRLTANFDDWAATLRQRHGQRIEDKRKSVVTVGVPLDDEVPEHGLLYASLPTEHRIPLPVLINADFYPSTNRKQILFDGDYQGDWNRAAIGAAARAFADALPALRDVLKPKAFWQLLTQCRALHDAAVGGTVDSSFKDFWLLAKEVVKAGSMVYTSTGRFCTAQEARLNGATKEAADCLPFYEALGLNMVHADLRPHYNVLREVGVVELDLDGLTSALAAAGLDEARRLEAVPEWLRDAAHRAVLAQVIDGLLGRVPKERITASRQRLVDCSLWLTTGGELAPASWLWHVHEPTRRLVGSLDPDDMWAADTNPPELLKLVDPFDLGGLVHVLDQAGPERIQACHRANPAWLRALLTWIDDRHIELQSQSQLRERLRQLALWPSGGELRPLDGLAVPGDFEDPLSLAQVLDNSVAADFRSLVVNHLGATSLGLDTYLTRYVPAAFGATEPLPATTRDELLRLVARHIGQIRDDTSVRSSLAALALVRCEDDEFRRARQLYLRSGELVPILGDAPALYVHANLGASPGLVDTLRWLGVSTTPKADDVVTRVDQVIAQGGDAARDALRAVFEGLARLWPQLVDDREGLAPLREKAWLPATKGSALLPPAKVFSSFRAFLFESQAQFLDVSQAAQGVAQQAPAPGKPSLMAYLGIRSEPTCAQVVQHLLHEAASGRKVNREVYTYLDQHHDDPVVTRLRDQACLAIEVEGVEGANYIHPRQAIRSTHPFGRFRHRLGADWQRFSRLLDVLDVREEPSASDAFAVLLEMAEDCKHLRQLSDEDLEVNRTCWTMLAGVLDEHPDWITQLAQRTVVPSVRRFLREPSGVYFEDRPGLAAKFDKTVQEHTIRRPEKAWVAMAAAGVRDLSGVVTTRIVECEDPTPSDRWRVVLHDRWPLVRRVVASLEAEVEASCPDAPPDVCDVSSLRVSYALGEWETPAESVLAMFDPDAARLVVVRGQRGVETALARELAFMILPHASSGPVAAALKELLVAESADAAEQTLSELGFADVVLGERPEEHDVPAAGVGAATGEAGPAADAGVTSGTTGGSDTAGGADGAMGPPEEQQSSGDRGGAGGATGDESGQGSGNGKAPRRGGTSRTGDGQTKPTSRKGKFVGKSFVQPSREAGEDVGTGTGNDHQLEVDRRGMELVMLFERQEGRKPRKMEHFNEGYDIESFDASGANERYIEVKSLSATWDMSNVGLSDPQFQKAREEGARFWLYVVDNLAGDKPMLHRVQDPASKVVEYRFDDGWRQVCESSPAPARRSILTAGAPVRTEESAAEEIDAEESS